MRATVEEKNGLKILAVTVLISFDEPDMRDMGLKGSMEEFVLKRDKKALDIGVDGDVSSGLEAGGLRDKLGENFLIVTPSIRPGANVLDDEIKDALSRLIV